MFVNNNFNTGSNRTNGLPLYRHTTHTQEVTEPIGYLYTDIPHTQEVTEPMGYLYIDIPHTHFS